MERGLFITLEGPDGAGKSTHGARLAAFLEAEGVPHLHTREPGGTAIGERVRVLLLDERHHEMAAETEMLLFAAARAQFVREVVRPALARGTTVLSERFADASIAYQGYGRGLDVDVVRQVNEVATGGLTPDLTILLDVDPATGLARARAAAGKAADGGGDRLEREAPAFYERVRAGFLKLASESPHRFVVISGLGDVQHVQRLVIDAVVRLLRTHRAQEAAP